MIFLCAPDVWSGEQTFCHLVSFGSATIRRVCRSTIQAETYQLQTVVEYADLIRAAIADCHGLLDRNDWEDSAASIIPAVWFTDCRSAHDALKRTLQKGVDKRLGIELAALRQSLWRFPGRTPLQARLQDEQPSECTDIVRWIDTAVMPADPLTKSMSDDFLQQILDSNIWNFEQPADSKAEKIKKQIGRKSHKKLEAMSYTMKNRNGNKSSGVDNDDDVVGQSGSE